MLTKYCTRVSFLFVPPVAVFCEVLCDALTANSVGCRVGRGELDVFEFDVPESSFCVLASGGHVMFHDSTWGAGGSAASRQPAAKYFLVSSGRAGAATGDLVKIPNCSALEYSVMSESREWLTRSATIDGVCVLCARFRVCACRMPECDRQHITSVVRAEAGAAVFTVRDSVPGYFFYASSVSPTIAALFPTARSAFAALLAVSFWRTCFAFLRVSSYRTRGHQHTHTHTHTHSVLAGAMPSVDCAFC